MFSKLLVKLLEWLLIGVFGLMVVLVFGNVVLRYGFNYGIIFSEEVSRFLFVWMVFLGSVLMLRDNGHLGVHTVTKLLPLAGKKACKFVSDATTLACCVLMTYGGWKIVGLNMVNYAPVSGLPIGNRLFRPACLQRRHGRPAARLALPAAHRANERRRNVSRHRGCPLSAC